ncbi:hypothetical protein [Microbacterium sp. XT11]|uniref:hypothetical protein n=1 Tax=Microbacterium sp. XT11 TaxID=367477 RepID=UPI000742DD1B|nr:hypothetical protein [Microbacterium sp. XT11]ALX66158.1 hypothetical protein AB663_001090 [Microbacterium sp. XT11]
MLERSPLEETGYVLYDDLVARLRDRFPGIPMARLEQIVLSENDAITGGRLHVVPAEVEAGADEMLQRESRRWSDATEVA